MSLLSVKSCLNIYILNLLNSSFYVNEYIKRMASLLKFAVNPVELRNAIKVKHDLAESSRRLHFIAARKIQVSHYPAVSTRY